MPQPQAHVGNMLASSATGTTFLILIQVASRLVTFASNQLVLRALSPILLGISAQLELYQVTILYFSRESIRMAIQRQPLALVSTLSDKDSPRDEKSTRPTQSVASQSVVNVSYLSTLFGVPIMIVLTILYPLLAPVQASETQFFQTSVTVTGLASLLELSVEPFFAVIQQRMWYEKRAAVEMPAVFLKSLTTCSAFLYASRASLDLGALPFALGHLSYSLALICGYCLTMLPGANDRPFSFGLSRVRSSNSEYFLGLFSRRLTSIAATVFLQSLVKHLLTQGDAMILAAVSSLEDQGIYSLAANYGGLVARVLFQPLEESSRNLFSTLLSPEEGKMRNDGQIRIAKTHLADILRVYQLLSVLIFPLGPVMVPQILHILGGHQWSSPQVIHLLSLYCCYIPFLAFNGITEAFVASAASPQEIRQQTAWMGVFSGGYALAAYLFLGVGSMGAGGLVLANSVNMGIRTLWSYFFIRSYFHRHSSGFYVMDVSLRPCTYILGAIATALVTTGKFSTKDLGIIPATAASGIFALSVLYVERQYIMEQMTRLRQILSSRTKNFKSE